MPNNTNDYLTSAIIKNDVWVKNICSAPDAETMADLIMKRITESNLHGPVVAYLPRSATRGELPSEIVYDLVINSYADYDTTNEAMALIMNKVLLKEIKPDPNVLENIFHIIEQLVLESCSDDLYSWIKENIANMESTDMDKRRTMMNAITAFAYCQKADCGLDEFWDNLWEHGNQFWWNTAFHGIRYCNFDKAISLIPTLIDRKCSNIAFLLTSMWRVKDDDRLCTALKKGIEDNEDWAGIAVNFIAFKMKWAEKTKLVERLHDEPSFSLSTEEEDHLETLSYFGD